MDVPDEMLQLYDGGFDYPGDPVAGDLVARDLGIDAPVPGADEWIPLDLDGDGFVDATGIDADHDGFVETVGVDVDHDGVVDVVAVDENLDGVPEVVQWATPVPPDNMPEPNLGADPRPHFDPESATAVIGDPESALEAWHLQTGNSCAINSAEFILDSLTGQDFTEAQLIQESIDNGWYQGGGTAMDDIGKILELHGVGVDRSYDNDFDSLVARLESGDGVIVVVDSEEIWNAGISPDDDLAAGDGGYPGADTDHAVQVAGVDLSDPDNPMVILNDSGDPNGQGVMIPVKEFMSAWADSDHYMVATTGGPS